MIRHTPLPHNSAEVGEKFDTSGHRQITFELTFNIANNAGQHESCKKYWI